MKILFFPAILGIFFFQFVQATYAQNATTNENNLNAVYLETGGPCLVYAIGYERTFFKSKRISVIASLGASFIPFRPIFFLGYIQPGALFHIKKSAIEIGAAISIVNESADTRGSIYGSTSTFFIPRLGYRYNFGKNRWFLKCGISPLIGLNDRTPDFTVVDESESGRNIIFWVNPISIGLRF